MKKVKLIEEFNTSRGKTFIVENMSLKVGEKILVNNVEYVVREIIFNSKPTRENNIAIIV